MRGPLLAVFLLAAPAAAQPSEAQRLHDFLQAEFAEIRESSPDSTYQAAFVDLNGDGRDEALVAANAAFFCGSGGCALYIYTPEGTSWRQVDELTVAAAPVRLLAGRTRGWRDLAATVRDGGMDPGREIRIRYDGSGYSHGPRLRGRVSGRVLIGDANESRALFE